MTESSSESGASTRGAIATGAAWMLAFKLTERSLGLVSTIVLARILLPADFGIVAMATSLIAILELLTSFSFDLALLQRHDISRKHFDTAWTFNLIFAVFVCALMIGLAQMTAIYYREPQLEAVVYALAFGWFVQGFENVGTVAFRRELDFRKEYWFLSAKKLSSVVVTLPLAFLLRNYWALVIGVVAGRCISVLISFLMSTYRPRLSLEATRSLMGFSGWLLINNVLYFLNQRISDFVIGRLTGAQALGLYNLSLEISNLPTTELAAPINRVVLPGYSKLAREKGQFGQTYLDTVGVMALFAMPAGLGIAAVAEPLVTVVLGPKWLGAIPLIQILGVYGTVASIGTNTASAMLALGRQRMLTMLAGIRLALLIPALIWSTQLWGIVGAAWTVLAVTAVMTPVNFLVLLPVLTIRMKSFLGYLWRPTVASIGMVLLVGEMMRLVATWGISNPFARLFIGVAFGIPVYVALVVVLWTLSGSSGVEAIVWRRVQSTLAAARRRF